MAVTVNQSSDMPAGFVRLGRTNVEKLDAATLEIGIATVEDAGKGGKHLDPSKEGTAVWSSGETWFAPESSAAEGPGLVLELGPRVTRHLKPYQTYWVHLRDRKGKRAKDRMVWPAVRLPTSPPAPVVRPKPEEPSPTPEVAPVPESDATPAEAPREVAPTAAAASTAVEEAAAAGEQQRNARNMLEIVAGLMGIRHWIGAAVAIVVLAFFLQLHKGNIDDFMSSVGGVVDKLIHLVDKVDDTGVPGDDGGTTSDVPGDDTATGGDGAVAPGDAGRRPPMTRAEVAPYLKEKPSAESALEEAGRAGDGGDREAAFLLLKYAARSGSAEAARRMGQLYDPATFAPGGVIKNSDAESAAEWYEQAATAGDVDAMVRLGEMLGEGALDRPDAAEQGLQWLRRAADAGSDKAKELLQ